MQELIIILIAMLIYGVFHSLMASDRLKSAFRQRMGQRTYQGLYRLFYNALALITLAPILLLVIFRSGSIVWSIPLDWEPLLLIIQAIGLIGLVISLLQIDLMRFAGLKQTHAYFTGGTLPLPLESMQTSGLYGFVRHPLYLFSLMVIWPVTSMTAAYLGFCIGATLYLLIGSIYEERRLIDAYGQEYRDYQARVPWMVPFMRGNNKP